MSVVALWSAYTVGVVAVAVTAALAGHRHARRAHDRVGERE
ncbi:hypothetical protein [Nocardia mangyaensis]|nr:hypothetical protein [Nocardia mangyaensis]MDO3648507.1 hypothetical protein [Nocardia mangyaensis]